MKTYIHLSGRHHYTLPAIFQDDDVRYAENLVEYFLEQYTQHRTLYLPNEVRLMLQVAGFHQITIRGDYTDKPAMPDSEELIFTALK